MDTTAAHYFPDTVIARKGPSAVAIQRFLGFLFLNLFLLTSWFSSLALFFSAAISEPLGAMIGLYGVLIYPVLLFLAVVFIESGKRSVALNKQHLLIFGGTILFLAAYGLMRGNSARVVVLDCFAFSTVLGGYIVGRRDGVWSAIRPMIVLLLAISVFCAFVFTSPLVLIDRTILVTQPGSHFEGLLVFAPLFCMVAAFERQRLWFYLLLALSIGSFLVYLYFGRRGITVRCGLELFAILFVIPAMLKHFTSVIRSAAIAVVLVAGLLVYFPFATLLTRYQGEAGFTDTVTKRNERWIEASELIQQMSPAELLLGRGMGGTYAVSARLDQPIFEEVETGVFARASAHANAANVLLKGGLLFILILYGPIGVAIAKLKSRRTDDYITLAVAISAIIALPFQTLEGTITYGSPWIAFGFGLLMSRAQNVGLRKRTVAVGPPAVA